MHSYHNVAELRQFHGATDAELSSQHRVKPPHRGRGSRKRLAAAPIDLDIEIPDLLAERVAVQPEQIGRPDLVAAGGRQRGGEQRHLDLLEDAEIKAPPREAHAE